MNGNLLIIIFLSLKEFSLVANSFILLTVNKLKSLFKKLFLYSFLKYLSYLP